MPTSNFTAAAPDRGSGRESASRNRLPTEAGPGGFCHGLPAEYSVIAIGVYGKDPAAFAIVAVS